RPIHNGPFARRDRRTGVIDRPKRCTGPPPEPLCWPWITDRLLGRFSFLTIRDGRSVTLRLTDKGNEVVARDPFEVLVRAVDSLDAEEQTAMHHALHQVLTTIAASGAHRPFGVCQDCAYLGGEMCCSSTSATLP